MTRDEYQALEPNTKAIATEAYCDGYQAAINFIESSIIRIDGGSIDTIMSTHKELLLKAM